MKKTYCSFHKLVKGATLHLVGVVEVLDSDELLESSTGKLSLFKKFGFSTHSVRGQCCGNGVGQRAHTKVIKKRKYGMIFRTYRPPYIAIQRWEALQRDRRT